MSKQITINELKEANASDYPVLLRELVQDPFAEQEAVLLDIIKYAADTEFGKKHNFSEIKSIDDFRAQVAVNEYNAFDSYIQRINDGEENILFPGKFFEFGGTTGTTGKSKLIPESETGDLIKRIVVKMRTAESSRMFPPQTVPGNKKFTVTNGSTISAGNNTITSASGQALARSDAAARARLVIPVELLQIRDIETPELDYLTMLFGVAERNVVSLICNNVIHMDNILRKLNKEPERYLSDIENGTLSVDLPEADKEKLLKLWQADPDRAKELRDIYNNKGKLEIADFWPSFGLVNCWLSSSVGRYAKEYSYLFPENTMFIHWGYGATEGKFDIPVDPYSPKGIPALFGYFFEFLELGKDKPVIITETKPNTNYELIITTYSGLYRYNIHDVVTVEKGDDGLYRLEFVCKSYDSIKLNGTMLYASEMTDYIEEYEDKHNMFIRYFHGEDVDGKLLLKIEPSADIDCSDFEEYIKEKLSAKGIDLYKVQLMPSGSREQALIVKFEGKIVNQTKLLVFK